MKARSTLLACLLLLAVRPAPATGGAAVTDAGARISPAAGAPEARVAVRVGDQVPGPPGFGGASSDPRSLTREGARFGGRFACRLTATAVDDLLFVDSSGTAIFRGASRIGGIIAFAGQQAADGSRFASFCETAAGADGSVAFHAFLADGRDGLFLIPAGGGPPEPVVLTGDALTLPDGPLTVGVIAGPAIGGIGVVAALDFLEGGAAVVAFARGAHPAVLIRSGDTLGSDVFQRSPTAPAENGAGRIAFTATLASGRSAVATLLPGAPPEVIFQDAPNPPPSQPPLTVDIAPPQVNDLGQVAFLWSRGGTVFAQTAGPPPSFVAGPGTAAPGGGTLAEITSLGPSVGAGGEILFGARRSNGTQGLYVLGSPGLSAAVEDGVVTASGETLRAIGVRDPDARPTFAPSGAIVFTARSPEGGGIFSVSSGVVEALVRSGDPVPTPAHYASFLETAIPMLGGGPSLVAGGSMVFDARVTGGSRGLFFRSAIGSLEVVALDGDPAPGGGILDGESFAFHSLGRDGTVAFVATAVDSPVTHAAALPAAPAPAAQTGPASIVQAGPASGGPSVDASGGSAPGPALFYGRGDLSGFSFARVIGVGDASLGSATTVVGLQPPSRVNSAGQVAVPVTLSDGGTALLGFDGNALFRVVGSGDPAPAGARFAQLFTGSFFLGTPIPPILGDDGTVLFGATTTSGDSALFLAHMQPGGGGVPERVVGAGDQAGTGQFTPFELQSLDRDASGRVALEAIFDENFVFGTFLKEASTVEAVARPFDLLGDLGFVLSVRPGLALTGDGGLAYGVRFFSGVDAILLRPAGASGTNAGPVASVDSEGPEPIAAVHGVAPDGGLYRAFQRGPRATSRLSTDGQGRVAFAAATDAGPEDIILFGAPANAPPVADAGPPQDLECAGPGGSPVQLDGTGSSDPDDDPLTYLWTGPFGQATGPRPTVTLPLGISVVTLVVNDGQASSEPATVTIVVRDTLPPAISAAASPALLWPPDGKMRDVSFAVSVSDRCDPRPVVVLVAVTVQDAAAGGRPGPATSGAAIGSDVRLFGLRADRSGAGSGRTYVVTYRATDESGNSAAATATVAVPHDLGR